MPSEDTPDSAVYLPGRNLLLLAKSSVWSALDDFGVVALGTLKGNPFADSGPEFFDGLAAVASLALARPLAVETPFARLSKVEVLERGRHLALELTFSCIDPEDGEHCGRCNKCAERRRRSQRQDWLIAPPMRTAEQFLGFMWRRSPSGSGIWWFRSLSSSPWWRTVPQAVARPGLWRGRPLRRSFPNGSPVSPAGWTRRRSDRCPA